MGGKATRTQNFIATERLAQGAFFKSKGHSGHLGAPYRLPPDKRGLNLSDPISQAAEDYFRRHGITWHIHASHGLSSQTCCLNFLMPLATRPDLLSRLVGGALKIEPPKMLCVEEGAFGEPWFVGFEWIGAKNYLGEWPNTGQPTRGANVTSADAVVRFNHDGRDETLLIEWKYTERYGAPLADRRSKDGKSGGNLTRALRYADKVFDPNGPIRADRGLTLEAFFYEPFYQLLRQQMLAWRMERGLKERVRVLHISPRGNRDLHDVTSDAFKDFGHADAFEAFKAVLAQPDDGVPRFLNCHTEDVFGPLLAEMSADPWADYLADRYRFLATGEGAA